MQINTRTQAIDMQQIDNRRFLFNPKTGVLVLGRQYKETSIVNSSHAVELADAGITKDFDDFVRGWIGTGGDYPKGVIHFAPCADSRNISLFDRAFDTLEMFRENGALAGTVVRGFGSRWEQPLSAILTDLQKAETKPTKTIGGDFLSINTITTEDLRRMDGKEGLILQGCGGELQEWLDGINEMFTENGILKNGTKFQDISAFEYDGLTCLLYPFEGVDLNIGKLAMWRLQTHENFGGTWLSDFVPNRLGGFIGEPAPEPEKPDCALIGQDGNIFNLVGIAARTLRRNDMADQAKEMSDRVFASGSYGEALCIIGEYVNITDTEPEQRPSLRQQLKETKTAEPSARPKPEKQQER